MAFRDLREFVALLERKGELRRIKAPVSCELEITEMEAVIPREMTVDGLIVGRAGHLAIARHSDLEVGVQFGAESAELRPMTSRRLGMASPRGRCQFSGRF